VDKLDIGKQTYSVGDFVYVTSKENESASHIINISRLWTDGKQVKQFYGTKFCKPTETQHASNKRFLDRVS